MKYVPRTLKRLLQGLLDLLLPLHCLLCRRPVPSHKRSVPLCTHHLERMEFLPQPACHTCARPLRPSAIEIPPGPVKRPPGGLSDPEPRCGVCRKKSLPLSRCLVGFAYRGTLRRLVRDWKFRGYKPWGPFLGARLAETVVKRMQLEQWDVLTPIPLHPVRRRRRGFNQSDQLADALQQALQIPRVRPLEKQRRTRPQAELSRRQRLDNVRGVFRVREPRRIENRSVLVVDDVFTTGTTVNEAARTLREAGARRVGALVLARALPRKPG